MKPFWIRSWALALVVAVLLLAVGCAGGDPASPADGATIPAGEAGGRDAAGDSSSGASAIGGQTDWEHTLQVVANVKASPPGVPVVYFLGGSVVRECVISETSWAAAVREAGGPVALTYDLGSRNRTTAQDLKLVAQLPDVPSLVLIGVNVGRFTPAQSSPVITLPEPGVALPPWKQHQYSSARILTSGEKRAALQKWLTRRYPLFKQHYTYNRDKLERLIKACKARGLRPVLVDLPRNAAIIGHRLDTPVGRYQRSCRSLAARHDIPFVNFVGAAKLVNRDFYDLWHLVEPGRAKWQALLAARTAALLLKYGMTGASASPSPSVSPTETLSPSPTEPGSPEPSGSPAG